MKNILLIDTSALLHKAKHTLGGKLSHKEADTGILFGFLSQVGKLCNRYQTNRIVFALDSPSSKRKKLYPEYKSNRNTEKTPTEKAFDDYCHERFDEVIDVIKNRLHFQNVWSVSGYEADDVIAAFIMQNPELARNSVIVSSDNDYFQLLHKCRGMHTSKDTLYTKRHFIQEWEISPKDWKTVKKIAGCFDEKTEILTNNGWKKFKKLHKDDLVFSMNPTTSVAEYCEIDNFIQYKYSGDMYRIISHSMDALVTPDHSFFGDTTQSYLRRGVVKFKEIQDILNYKNFTIPLTVKRFNGNDSEFITVPDVTRQFVGGNGSKITKLLKGFKIKTKIFMAFLGIYLADGYSHKNRNGKIGVVGLCKSKPRKVRMIRRVLDDIGLKYSFDGKQFIIHSVPLAQYLHKMGDVYTKRIPQEFKNMSSKYLRILWSYMVLCDGHTRMTSYTKDGRRVNQRHYFTVNSGLAKDFQEIVVKSGSQCSIISRPPRKWNIKGKSGWSKKQYNLHIKKTKFCNIKGCKIDTVPFDGMVYDVETKKYHTILVRRNKKVYWSSNCSGDGVSSVPGVRYKTAVNYLKGTALASKVKLIESEEMVPVMRMASRLTRLPFDKLITLPDFEENYLCFDDLLEICTIYGFNSIVADRDRFSMWEKIFNGDFISKKMQRDTQGKGKRIKF